MPAITAISTRKPMPGSDRCGVSSAENSVGSAGTAAWALLSLMRLHYTGFMARKTTPKPATKAAKKAKPGKPKAVKPEPWTRAEVEEAFRRFARANPAPKGELQHINPYTLLVAVVLSAQATDAGVNKATPALFAAADTPEKMAALGEEKVREFI